MDQKQITEANRKAWNHATEKHQAARKGDLKLKFAQPGYSCLDKIETAKLKEIGLEGKTVAQLGCNNGREIISVVNLGAQAGVGFDISDAATKEAEELASIANANCRFVRTDVYEIGEEWHGRFDIVYITIGALSWLPDLNRFFVVVRDLLKPGGHLLIYEQHPFLYVIGTKDDPEFEPDNPLKAVFSYFRTEPWAEDGGIDYIGGTRYESSPCYSYTQKLSDILNPIVGNGMRLVELQEYGHDISNVWAHVEEFGVLPMCYLLVARRD